MKTIPCPDCVQMGALDPSCALCFGTGEYEPLDLSNANDTDNINGFWWD